MAPRASAWYPLGAGEVHVLDVAILKAVGFGALGVLVLGWLAVSLQAPGRTQRLTARLASVAMYLALACLFTHLTQENWARGRAMLYVPFGFLLAVFVTGFVLSLIRGAGELTSAKDPSASATH